MPRADGRGTSRRHVPKRRETGRGARLLSALDSLQSATDLLDKRWSATFQMVQAIGNNNKEGDEAKAIKGTFRSVNNEWELRYANIDALVEFNVDRPFGVDAKRIPDALWLLPCNAFPFDGEGAAAIDSNSAHIILTLINYCQRLVTDNLGKTQTTRPRASDCSTTPISSFRTSTISTTPFDASCWGAPSPCATASMRS